MICMQAAKDETKSKGGAPAKYPENAKAVRILLRAAKDAHHPTAAEAREALKRVKGDPAQSWAIWELQQQKCA